MNVASKVKYDDSFPLHMHMILTELIFPTRGAT